ncbi:MAG: pirin family protein, partial [Klebsiella sp.]|nr:pirin family protein [Klebsiella sp.]
MITTRTAKQCGQADFGWLQARYTFSFGHYFDPKLLGYASLRVLNQEVLAPGASFQPRTYPKVDILNLILEGEAEYRDSDGNHIQAKAGEALLDSYQQERRDHAKAMIDLSVTAGNVLAPPKRWHGTVRDGISWLLNYLPPVKRYFLEMRFKP